MHCALFQILISHNSRNKKTNTCGIDFLKLRKRFDVNSKIY